MKQAVGQLELAGQISGLTIPSLIQPISQTGETGVLQVREGRVEKSVYFQDGRAIFAASTDPEDRLGELFLRKGILSLENLIEAGETSARKQKRLGTVLVEFGCIRPEDLVQGVIEQVKEILLSIFLFTRGDYHFRMGPLPTKEVITLQISTGDIILQGIKRISDWHRIWKAVGDLDTTYRNTDRIQELTEGVTLALEEWAMLSHLDRPITVRELCAASPIKDFEVCRLLWAFLVLGIVSRIP